MTCMEFSLHGINVFDYSQVMNHLIKELGYCRTKVKWLLSSESRGKMVMPRGGKGIHPTHIVTTRHLMLQEFLSMCFQSGLHMVPSALLTCALPRNQAAIVDAH